MSQYIGRTISLISSKGIRYVGILDDVNGEESTVTLKNVQPFGTEGRLNDPSKEIAPSNDVYPVVVFRGSDVHDLSVLDDPAPTPTPSTNNQQTQSQQVPKPTPSETATQQSPPSQPSSTVPQPQPQPIPQQRPQRQQHQQQRYNNFASTRELPKNDFDFEQNNAKFDDKVEELKNEQQPEQSEQPEQPAYDKKKSFFDTISNSNDRPERPNNNNNNNNFGNNRGGFRRGRGGRGRGRGRGNYRGESKPAWA